MTQGEPLPQPTNEAVMTARLIRLRTWLRCGNAYMEHPDGQDFTEEAADAIDAMLARLAAIEQDARRWREVRQCFASKGPFLAPEAADRQADAMIECADSVDDAAIRLASRSLPGALKEEKDNG